VAVSVIFPVLLKFAFGRAFNSGHFTLWTAGTTENTQHNQDEKETRSIGWPGSLPISPIRANRWFVTMASTQINQGGLGKKQARMTKCRP
jgi:hypothetical protein